MAPVSWLPACVGMTHSYREIAQAGRLGRVEPEGAKPAQGGQGKASTPCSHSSAPASLAAGYWSRWALESLAFLFRLARALIAEASPLRQTQAVG
jgi:hypothetical protein